MNTTNKLTLPNGTSQRGAQFGRPNILPTDSEAPIKLRLEKLRWVDGDYDQGGAYWGNGSQTDIFCAWGKDKHDQLVQVFVRAATRAFAKHLVVEKVTNATFYDGPGSPVPPPEAKHVQFTLRAPVAISPRLLPGLRVGADSWVSIEYAPLPGRDGRTRYRYFIDAPGIEHTASDLQSGTGGGTLQEGLESLLSFLDSADEELFPAKVVAWAEQNSSELEILKCEVQDTKGLIEEV